MTSKRYSLADYAAYVNDGVGNLQDLPNQKEITAEEFLHSISAHGHSLTPHWGYTSRVTRGNSGTAPYARKAWTQLFFAPDGTGLAVQYPNHAFRFALCQHEKALRPTDRPNHNRGWHPGYCVKCGLNMDEDSGD